MTVIWLPRAPEPVLFSVVGFSLTVLAISFLQSDELSIRCVINDAAVPQLLPFFGGNNVDSSHVTENKHMLVVDNTFHVHRFIKVCKAHFLQLHTWILQFKTSHDAPHRHQDVSLATMCGLILQPPYLKGFCLDCCCPNQISAHC